jgi:Flp pilus assembly protein TadG
MVEFAYSIPVLLLLIFGLIDFSRAAYTAAVVQWAAQEGARSAIIDPATVTQAIEGRLVGLQANRAGIVVTPSADGSEVTVQVTYPFEFVTPIIGRLGNGGVQMNGSASMIVQPPLIGQY